MFNLFKSSKSLIINDELFGELELFNGKHKFFSGKIIFTPTENIIDITIDVQELNGPTSQQKDFFKNITSNYLKMKERIQSVFEDEFRNKDTNFKISNFDKEFTLTGLHIPEINSGDISWLMTYIHMDDKSHYFNISIKNFEPQNGLAIDS